MSQNSNISYLNFLKKVGISSFLQNKPNIFYENEDNKNNNLSNLGINEVKKLNDLESLIIKSNNLKFKNYFNKINETIVSTLHMINIYNHNEALIDTFQTKPIGVRISTFGICEPKTGEEKMFFLLDNVSDVVYYYAYSKKEIEMNLELFNKIIDA